MSPLVLRQNCDRAKSISRVKFFRVLEPISCNPSKSSLLAVQVSVFSEVWRIMCHPSRLFSRVSRCRATLISLLTSTRGQLCVRLFLWLFSFSLSLPLYLFFFLHELQRVSVPVSHFFSSRGEPSRLIFFPVAHPTSTVVYNSGREISTYLCTCEMNIGCRCGRHFIKATSWRFSFCPAVFGN